MVISLSPRHLAYLVFRRRKVFIGSMAIALLLYSVLVLTQKPQFESYASIVVKVVDQDVAMPDRLTEQSNQSAASNATLAKEVINSVQVVVTSEDVLDNTLNHVGVSTVYPKLVKDAAKAKVPVRNAAIEALLQDVSVKVNNDTNVLSLSLFNTNPVVARNTLQALVQATVSKHASIMRDPRLSFLERKLAALKAQSDAAQKAVLDHKQKTGITSFDEERSLLLRQRDTIQTSKNQIQADLFAATGRAQSLESSLSTTPHQIALSDENDRIQRQLDVARDRLTAAERNYEAARQRFTEGNPELIDTQAQLESARKAFQELSSESQSRVRTGANPVAQTLSQSYSMSRSDVNAQKAAIAEREAQLKAIDERLAFLNANEITVRDLERKRDLLEREYRSYLERAQSARIMNDMNEAGITSLSVLQAPTLPYKPARPKKTLMLILAVLVGLAAGLALCIFMETMDDTIALPEQVESTLGLPLLAVVNQHGPEGSP